MRFHKVCLACGTELKGRIDKKFCDMYCRGSYHYNNSQLEKPKFYNRVDNQLKLNRRILKEYNKAGKATVRSETLLDIGFNPNFFTHYWKNQKGDVYLFCYEYGFLEKKEGERKKYVLVQWQEYMEK